MIVPTLAASSHPWWDALFLAVASKMLHSHPGEFSLDMSPI